MPVRAGHLLGTQTAGTASQWILGPLMRSDLQITISF